MGQTHSSQDSESDSAGHLLVSGDLLWSAGSDRTGVPVIQGYPGKVGKKFSETRPSLPGL